MLVWTRKSVFPHKTSTFPSSKLKASWGVMVVGLVGSSSSEVSAIVKSEKVEMLMIGDWVMGDAGIASAPGTVTGSGTGC